MPSTLPSSFASAAAGRDDASSARTPRADGGSFGDWPRRPNGATQTFRRTSTATSLTQAQQQRDSMQTSASANPPNMGTYVPPHIAASRNGPMMDMRYSKSQLLDLFRDQKIAGNLENGLADLYVGEGDPVPTNGTPSGRWTRREEQKHDTQAGTESCWDRGGGMEPLGLVEMTDEEKEIFTTSVNSTVKTNPPGPREQTQREPGGRKLSMSQGFNPLNPTSPATTRGINRRRDPSESYPFPRDNNNTATGGFGRGGRDEAATNPALGLVRRKTELLDSEPDVAVDEDDGDTSFGGALGNTTPYGTVKRRAPGPLSAGLVGPSSPWGPSAPSNFGTMGTFGTFAASGGTPSSAGPGRVESRFRGLMSKPSLEAESPPRSRHESPVQDDEPSGRAGLSSLYEHQPSHLGHNVFAGEEPEGSSGYRNESGVDPFSVRGLQERQGGLQGQVSQSPTYTNPYQSPPPQLSELQEIDADDSELEQFHLPGLGGFQAPLGPGQQQRDIRSNDRTTSYEARYFERNQPPSIQTRGFPGLGGIGGLTGLGSPGPWSSNPAHGTPTRERSGFPDMYSEQRARTPGEVQSPAFPAPSGTTPFGAVGGPGQVGTGTIGRASKLGSLFSASLQEQTRTAEHVRDDDSLRQDSEPFGDIGSHPFGANPSQLRDIDSPARGGRGKFEDFFGGAEKQHSLRGSDPTSSNELSGPTQQYPPTPSHGPGQFTQQGNLSTQQQGGQRVASLSSTASNQPPAAQQKTMVMPDRIRWIYRDPQGNTQGPWSGLEMHDWYRAGFFSPELLVKKVEDADYEPLAQLIRRIGNSREPFLVPQIGIPGPPTSQSGNWPNQSTGVAPAPVAPSAQPPFAGSFPSFGTTLTAEQQNALERRKQEEQYLMARQKEHLAQQQLLMKQMQVQGGHGARQQQLQHQQSVQSLHSQSSFGNITSPGGFQNSSIQGLGPGHQGGVIGREQGFGAGVIGTNDASNVMRTDDGARPFDQPQTEFPTHAENADEHETRVNQMLSQRARLAAEQAEDEGFPEDHDNQRLEEFRNLRRYDGPDQQSVQDFDTNYGDDEAQDIYEASQEEPMGRAKNLSLAEQIQKAASAKQSPLISGQIRSEVPSLEATPPPQSASPLPAPAARRNRSHVADALAAESISQSQTPSIETPTLASVAPWAREPAEQHKLPSLKEIQEAEARNAAKQEEIAAALRRVQLEKELIVAQPPPAPGLPSTSTWASTESSSTAAASTGSAWAKASASKTVVATGTSSTKKTMQQIVQEEEALARKKKAALTAAAASSVATGAISAAQAASMGKRYADLASKVASTSPVPLVGGAWTTVGASGKTKAPIAPTTPSVPVKATTTTTAAVIRPKSTTTPSKTSLAAAQLNAHEEFKKWAIAELRPDLHKDIQVDDFVLNLLNFPSDTDLITEAVHMSSRTVDSRHFAEEFVRRRALADKGKVAEPSANAAGIPSGGASGDGKGAGGWSEVARKGGSSAAVGGAQKEERGEFKIVAAKKKGAKK